MARELDKIGQQGCDRRRFLVGGAVVAGSLVGCAHADPPAPSLPSAVPASPVPAPPSTPPQEEAKGIKRYRTLGRTGFKVSDIGFGCGRISDANVLRFAYDQGVNYFDVAEVYAGGESERQLGEVMPNLDRRKVFITTKLKVSADDTADTLRDRFGKCQERMKTDYVDALYIHNPDSVAMAKHAGFHQAVARLKGEGRLKHAGISSHGPRGKSGEPMEAILCAAAEDGRFDLMLLVYNFLNAGEGERVLAACKAKNIGTSAMKVSPGVLNDEANRARLEPFLARHALTTQEQVNQAGIQWVLGNNDMHTVCVSMADFDKVEKTIPLSGSTLSREGLALLESYRAGPGTDHCRHGCDDCAAACPHGLPVSTIMRYAYYFHLQGREKYAMGKYAALGVPNASVCEGCDAPCLGACPHGVRVRTNLLSAHRMLSFA